MDTLFKKNLKDMGFSKEQIDGAIRNARSSMDGQIEGETTYAQWLKRQTATRQNQALGTKRARLFRSGKAKIEHFADQKTGRDYSIDELIAKHPDWKEDLAA